MKILLAIIFSVVGIALAVPTSTLSHTVAQNSMNSTQCVYSSKKMELACKGDDDNEIIECSAEAKFGDLSKDLTVFGISRIVDVSKEISRESVRYWFYPRSIDNATYRDHKVLDGSEQKDLVLYYSEKFIDFGIRVTDEKCYISIVQLFDGATMNHMVSVNGDEKEDISLFGEVLIANQETAKRYVTGFGWGIGLSPWNGGWGGILGLFGGIVG
jgi:hypothetical protein